MLPTSLYSCCCLIWTQRPSEDRISLLICILISLHSNRSWQREKEMQKKPTKFYIPGVSLRNSTQDKCGRWMIETTGHRQITTRCSRDQAFWLSVIKASIRIAGICEKRSHKYPREINWTLRSIKQKPRLTDLTLAREESQPRNNKFLRVSYAIIYNIVHDKYQNNRNKLLIYSLFPRARRTLFSGVRSLQLLDQFWCFPRFNNVSSFDMQRSAMTTTSLLFPITCVTYNFCWNCKKITFFLNSN